MLARSMLNVICRHSSSLSLRGPITRQRGTTILLLHRSEGMTLNHTRHPSPALTSRAQHRPTRKETILTSCGPRPHCFRVRMQTLIGQILWDAQMVRHLSLEGGNRTDWWGASPLKTTSCFQSISHRRPRIIWQCDEVVLRQVRLLRLHYRHPSRRVRNL